VVVAWSVAGVIADAATLVLPNALWLVRLTCEIRNRSQMPMEAVQLQAPVLLPRRGDATLSLAFRTATGGHQACREYVEGEMDHVETGVCDDGVADCTVTLPLFSQLLATKLGHARISRGNGA
jgi:hypothetical protein